MKTIIPSAGLGTRMRPITFTTPKILIKLGEKAIIDYILEKLIANGINEISMILNPQGEKIKSYIQKRYSLKIKFIFQPKLNGIAHAVSMASEDLTDEPVLVVLGDTIFEGDLKKIIRSKYSCLAVKEVENPKKYGVVILNNNGFVKKLVEKPDTYMSNLAIVGIYFFKNGIRLKNSIDHLLKNNVKTKGEYQITDAIQNMVDSGEKITTHKIDNWFDCGTPAEILSSHKYILKKYPNKPTFAGSVVIDPCYVSPTADIANSVIGPYVTIGEKTKIVNSVIKNSIVGENSNIEYMILKDSIIGGNTNIKNREQSLIIGDITKINP